MASIVKIKRSSVQGKAPTVSDIQSGELALNTRDGKLFSSDGSGVFEVGANLSSLSVTTSLTTPRLTITDSSQTDVVTTIFNSNPSGNTTSLALVNDTGDALAIGITGSGFTLGNTELDNAFGTIAYANPANTVDSFVIGNQANTYIFGGADGVDGGIPISITDGLFITFNSNYTFPRRGGTTNQVLTVVNDETGELGFENAITDIASQLADDTGYSNSSIGLTSIFDLALANSSANLGFITDSETTDAFGMRTARNNIYDCMEPDGRVVELNFGTL